MKGESGTFHCPQCNGARQYTQRKVRRFFTLYFIPLIPLDLLGEYIECNYCHGTFKPEVLHYAPAIEVKRADTQIRTTLNRAFLSVLVADGSPSEPARAAALEAMRSVGGDSALTLNDVEQMVAPAMKRVTNPATDVEAISESLDYATRENLVRAALSIASADGQVSAAQERQIRALGKASGLSDAHVSGIISTYPSRTA